MSKKRCIFEMIGGSAVILLTFVAFYFIMTRLLGFPSGAALVILVPSLLLLVPGLVVTFELKYEHFFGGVSQRPNDGNADSVRIRDFLITGATVHATLIMYYISSLLIMSDHLFIGLCVGAMTLVVSLMLRKLWRKTVKCILPLG